MCIFGCEETLAKKLAEVENKLADATKKLEEAEFKMRCLESDLEVKEAKIKELKTKADDLEIVTQRRFTNDQAVYDHKIKTLDQQYEIALKAKDFEMLNCKDQELLELRKKTRNAQETLAVAEKENELLREAAQTAAAIIDVKELVSTLITKLPEIKISNLTVGGNQNGNGV